jgi:O-acetyl-ADP-ribose deacetylase (regulator of RNase III)
VSAGVYGWPMASAAEIAIDTVREHSTGIEVVTFVLYGEEAFGTFAEIVTPV